MSAFQDAAQAALSAVNQRVYADNAVPSAPTYPYQTVAVTSDRALAYTLDANHGVRSYRVVVRSMGRSMTSASDLDERAITALLDNRLSATGYACDPCRLELGSALVRDSDDEGVLVITTTLTFNATKEA
jgi:hypothetical protein